MDRATTSAARDQNPRGQGARLREDILLAARRLLEDRGVEDAITLRAVARGARVTAPALYAHFRGRQEIIEAVIDAAFQEYVEAFDRAIAEREDPVARLRAGCRVYLDFAHQQPATFRILFDRHRPSPIPRTAKAAAEMFQTFVDTLTQCHQAGGSRSSDPRRDAVRLWLGLHGLATLPSSHPRFPWPEEDRLLDDLLQRFAGIERSPDATLFEPDLDS